MCGFIVIENTVFVRVDVSNSLLMSNTENATRLKFTIIFITHLSLLTIPFEGLFDNFRPRATLSRDYSII